MRRAVYEIYEQQWHEGNDAGRGFAVDEDYFDGWTKLYESQNDTEISIYRNDTTIVGVGDAHGLWGVELNG